MAISGKNAKVQVSGVDVAEVRNWKIDQKSDLKAFNSSGTSGHTNRVAGNDDWSGSFEVYEDDLKGPSSLAVGSSFVGKFYANATKFYTGTAFVSGISSTGDVEGANLNAVIVTFEGSGALTQPA